MSKIFLVLAVGLLGCSGGGRLKLTCSDDDGTSLAVYHQLGKTLRGYNEVNAWIDHPSKDALAKEQKEIDRIRTWLTTAQLEPCVRSQYNQWLDYYYQHGLNEAYKEILEHGQAQEMEKFRADNERERKEAQKLIEAGKIPAPPKN